MNSLGQMLALFFDNVTGHLCQQKCAKTVLPPRKPEKFTE